MAVHTIRNREVVSSTLTLAITSQLLSWCETTPFRLVAVALDGGDAAIIQVQILIRQVVNNKHKGGLDVEIYFRSSCWNCSRSYHWLPLRMFDAGKQR